jgi:1,4-alpha-glucan branching enzyme
METPTLSAISRSQILWHQQKRPEKPSWRIWKRFLSRLTIASTNILKEPLGSWLPSWNQQRTWNILTNRDPNIIMDTRINTQTLTFRQQRRASHHTQLYFLTENPPTNPTRITYTGTPTHFTPTHIVVTENTPSYTWLRST